MVRGKEISFAPQDIKRVLRLRKDPLPNAASYEERVANKDYRLDHVQEDMFIEGGEWMVNETMYYPYQNTARQFREMEAQGVPVTIANLAIHRHREEEMNRERMRHKQMVHEAAAERAREANKGKTREVAPDFEEEESEEMYSSPSEEW
ncbi:hypothetical protein PIB30_052054 [Stylosanthes scabra]|uniref:Uncharacterized protein n=1 Tax=Stylosanthes scabra TaxID=79078 RepID=A0ABU6UIX3_9FABA|nr:hypothetical protein [Stylosanthes scabra]